MFETFQQSQHRQHDGEAARTAAARFWEQFAHRHGHDLVRCAAAAARRIGWRAEPSEVDEIVQEVYCRLLEGRFPAGIAGWPPEQLWGYLQRIVRSVIVDEVRSRCARKRGGVPQGEASASHGNGGTATLGDRRAPGPTPEERLLSRERARALRRRIHELGAEHGARNLRILELAAVEGCTAAEISRRLAGALTASSIHTVLHRLRQQLAAMPGPELAAMVEV
jgi:RNA polymerase sigma factor (sigma-70 family)